VKVIIDGAINVYYVQTLCMIYFPGTKFAEDEIVTPDTPILRVTLREDETQITADASLQIGERIESATHTTPRVPERTTERTRKLAVGAAVTQVCGDMLDYRPSWGMLTGVRPSKVATQLLLSGVDRAEVERQLSAEYFVIPKKAALATEVACNEQKIIGTPDKKDCSVYISIPFCPSRCAYCSFVSYTSKRLLSLIPEYLTKLAAEIERMFETIRMLGLRVRTIYIGGGTPTILDADQLRFLLTKVAQQVDVSTLAEYTLESGRPDTIDAEKFRVARELGINRISVNPQSLCEDVLRGIGRGHTVEDFYRAYEIAEKSGIPIINTDLIVGLPGDTFPTFSYTYDKILELAPDNITVHTFCVKKSAEILHSGENVYSIHGGDAGKCVDYSQIRAEQSGYLPYYMYRQKNTVGNFENVGFAKPGTEGLYNIYMMEEVHSIFAAGAGAVSKLVDYVPETQGKSTIRRLFNPKYPYEYLTSDTSDEMKRATLEFYRERGMI
jgi:oxygen-independent coproporphyrinogen-3 oxidase